MVVAPVPRFRLVLFLLALCLALACGIEGHPGRAQPGSPEPDPTGSGGDSGGAGGTRCAPVPADVQSVLSSRCQICHGSRPLPTVPSSLVTVADFSRPAKSAPTITVAQATMMRLTGTDPKLRMPPAPADPLSAAEIQILQAWFDAGMPPSTCGDAGTPADPGPDPYAVAPRCTSGTTWTGGTRESPLMQPGEPCVACHTRGEAPRLSFGGTIYPSAHEPSQCYGASGVASAQGAAVVVVDATGKSVSANVNAAGNFYVSARTALTPPLKAKVTFMGRERVMIGAVDNGDCNACHTQKGTTTATAPGTVAAPGRILLP
jgi:hypothetical protein